MKKKEMQDRSLPTSSNVEDHKQKAMDLAKNINAKILIKGAKAQTHAKKVVKSKYGQATPNTPISAKQIAEQMAAKLNNKMGYQGRGPSIEEQLKKKDSDDNKIQEYEEALEINDFPQSVRFRCCNRDTLNHLTEYLECRVCIRGRYYEEVDGGPENEDDDPRLYIEIIADNEMKVARCKAEI